MRLIADLSVPYVAFPTNDLTSYEDRFVKKNKLLGKFENYFFKVQNNLGCLQIAEVK